MSKKMYPKDLIAAIEYELEQTIEEMIDDPENFGLSETLTRQGKDERLSDMEDREWVKQTIGRHWIA